MRASEQPMPYDLEAEMQLLGTCMVDPKQLDRASDLIGPEHFYDPFFGRIFEMMLTLQAEGEDVTPPILASVMKTDPAFREKQIEANPPEFFDTLRHYASYIHTSGTLAKILLDQAQRRDLIRLSEELAADVAAGMRDAPVSEILDKYQSVVDGLLSATSSLNKNKPIAAGDAGSDMLHRIEAQATAEKPHGVSTGLEFLDKIIGALFPGKLLVGAGRPGMGKSQLGTGIARHAARFIPADYLSGEMDNDELSARVGADIDFDTAAAEKLEPLKYGDFVNLKVSHTGHFERMVMAVGEARALDLNFLYRPGMTLEWIESTIRRRCREKPGHRLVVIDHLQLIDWEGAPRGTSPVQIVTRITKRLKALAGELGITILLLSQLSRDVEKREDKHPQLADLRESGSTEQDADIVIFLMRPLVYARQKMQAAKNGDQKHTASLEYDDAKDVLKVAVAKNRGGRTTEYAKLFIKPEASAIRDRAPDTDQGADLIDWGKLAEDLR